MSQPLFILDVLPPNCSVEAQMRYAADGRLLIRFRAKQTRLKVVRTVWAWSGWFTYVGEPIHLQWQVLKTIIPWQKRSIWSDPS